MSASRIDGAVLRRLRDRVDLGVDRAKAVLLDLAAGRRATRRSGSRRRGNAAGRPASRCSRWRGCSCRARSRRRPWRAVHVERSATWRVIVMKYWSQVGRSSSWQDPDGLGDERDQRRAAGWPMTRTGGRRSRGRPSFMVGGCPSASMPAATAVHRIQNGRAGDGEPEQRGNEHGRHQHGSAPDAPRRARGRRRAGPRAAG